MEVYLARLESTVGGIVEVLDQHINTLRVDFLELDESLTCFLNELRLLENPMPIFIQTFSADRTLKFEVQAAVKNWEIRVEHVSRCFRV